MNMKKSMISMAAASLLAVGFAGCGDDSNAVTSGKSAHYRALGSVTGTVQDTNGNPIKDVSVYLAGQTVKTDAGGVYRFNSVPATQVFDVGVTANELGEQLSVTIAAPAGYIGATVTVRPAAQIDSSTNATNGVETFIDGFIASAGTAVLPQTNTTVTGILRDNTTGEPLANKVMNFEFTAGGTNGATDQEQDQNGVETTYAVPNYTITTDANGAFSFASLPSDSEFTILVPTYTVSKVNTINTDRFDTDGETNVTLGNVTATAITALDGDAPFVYRVDGVMSNVARGLLNDDTRNTFVVHFSETLTASELELAGNSILLYAGAANKEVSIPYTATIDATSKIITITTTTVLNDGDNVDILFLNADTVDTSMNPLTTGASVAYDYSVSNYTKLQLEIFSEANTNAPAVTAEAQLGTDSSGLDDDALVQASNATFNDVLDETAGFQQLNSADNDDSAAGIDSEERLNALAVELGANSVTVSETRITFTPQGAPSYFVTVLNNAGTEKSPTALTGVNYGTSTNVNIVNDFGAIVGTTGVLEITVSDTLPVELYITDVAPTDTVVITPVDDLGYAGTDVVITLADNVAPTTILQKSYYAGGATSGDNASGTVVKYGDGGELADANGALTIGTPYLAVNNSLLDNLDGAGENVTTGVNPDQTLVKELFESGVVNNEVGGTGLIYLDGTGAYDAQAIAAFNVDAQLGRKMGVAFSEDIATLGTPTYSATGISGYAIQNDVITNVSGQTVNADLITMDVANVMTLANVQNLETIDYAGIADESNNTSTTASVVIKDEMAPMVLSASYTSANAALVVTFNEAIALTDAAVAPAVNSTLTVNGATATYSSAATTNQWVVSGAGNNILTIPAAAFSTPINNGLFWTAGAVSFAYPDDNYLLGDTTVIDHQNMDFSAISDTLGNSWDSYAVNTGARAVTNPEFATAFNTSNFSSSTPTFGATDTTANTQTVVFTLSQPVRISNAADTFNGITPNGAGEYFLDGNVAGDLTKIRAAFTGVIDPAGTPTLDQLTNGGGDTSLKLSANRKTITLIFRTTTDLTSTLNDIVRLNSDVVVSDGDTSQSLAGNGIQATAL